MEEEKNIDIKGTLKQFIEPDEPELEQEEAIRKYQEKPIKKNSSDGDINDNTEEQEHLNRIKQELLASLERVKKLAEKIYGKAQVSEREKLKVKKQAGSSVGKGSHEQTIEKEVKEEKEPQQKERD